MLPLADAETPLADTHPLERNKSVPFKMLLEHVAMGGSDPDVLSSLASRLARLARECGPDENARIREASGGVGLTQIAHGIVDALDPDARLPDQEGGRWLPAAARYVLPRRAASPARAPADFRSLPAGTPAEPSELLLQTRRAKGTFFTVQAACGGCFRAARGGS
jgi:hypothetical protein